MVINMTKTKTLKIVAAFSLAFLLGTTLFIASQSSTQKSSASFQSVDQLVDLVINPTFATKACCK